MLKDYLLFSWSNLTHKKLRSWLTLLGIFIGVVAVVSLVGLGEGLKAAVTSQFGVSSTEVITVQAGGLTGQGPPGSGVSKSLTKDDVEDISRLSSVDFAISRVIEQGQLEFKDKLAFSFAMNVPDGKERDFVYESLDLEPETGRYLKDGDGKRVNLGYNFGADKAGLDKEIKAGDTILFKDEKFEVVGIYEKKGSFIFDNIIVINEKPLEDLMDNPDRVDVIAVKVKDKDLIDKAKTDIEKIMRKNRDVDEGEEDFTVQTPDQALSTVNSVLSGVQAFIVLIASISILVGAIGIVNTMTTAVLERKKQIGIMKAIGAKNSDIFYQFFIESGLMGLMGGLMGLIVGETIALLGTQSINAFFQAEVDPQINIIFILATLAGSFIIGSLAGIIPAMRAAKQHPVDALRS